MAESVGIIVGVLGIILGATLSYVFYKRELRILRLKWSVRTHNVIQGFERVWPELRLRYKGQNVENFSVSKIMVWSDGTETIKGSDVAASDPIRVQASPSTKLLEIELIQQNHQADRVHVNLQNGQNSAIISFDFLDRGHGFVIQVFHTGTTSSDVLLAGTVIGGGEPIPVTTVLRRHPAAIPALLGISLAIPASILLTALAADLAFTSEYPVWLFYALTVAIAVVVSLLGTLIGLSIVRLFAWIAKTNTRIPRGLESYADEIGIPKESLPEQSHLP